jgi:uracil-DNA glycosylase
MTDTVPESWRAALDPVLALPESRRLGGWLRAEEERGAAIYPPRGQRLRALELTPLHEVKVVILGQDPYHGPGQAHGLCFSVPDGVPVPPSLLNVYKELESDLGIARRATGNLEHWARQGVLLLNNSLTVEAGKAGSHARKKAAHVRQLSDDGPHLVLTSPHPSPLSAHSGFFGSRPFSKTNAFLTATGRGAIDW